jgi:hypothetical protein
MREVKTQPELRRQVLELEICHDTKTLDIRTVILYSECTKMNNTVKTM